MFTVKIEANSMQELRSKILGIVNDVAPLMKINGQTGEVTEVMETNSQVKPSPEMEMNKMMGEVFQPKEIESPVQQAVGIVPPTLNEAIIKPAIEAVEKHIEANPVDHDYGEDKDIRGIGWDDRIHGKTKNKNKDGTWRNKKGVDKDLLHQVENELRQNKIDEALQTEPLPAPPTGNAQAEAPNFGVNPLMSTSQIDNHATIPDPVVVTPVPATTPDPVPPPAKQYENIPTPTANPSKPAHTLDSFKANIVNTLAQLTASGAINQEYVSKLNTHFKVAQIWEVFGNESQVSELYENFCETGLITRI